MDVATTLLRLNFIFYCIPTVQVPSPLEYLSTSLWVATIVMTSAIIIGWKEALCAAIWIIWNPMKSPRFALITIGSRDETSIKRSYFTSQLPIYYIANSSHTTVKKHYNTGINPQQLTQYEKYHQCQPGMWKQVEWNAFHIYRTLLSECNLLTRIGGLFMIWVFVVYTCHYQPLSHLATEFCPIRIEKQTFHVLRWMTWNTYCISQVIHNL